MRTANVYVPNQEPDPQLFSLMLWVGEPRVGANRNCLLFPRNLEGGKVVLFPCSYRCCCLRPCHPCVIFVVLSMIVHDWPRVLARTKEFQVFHVFSISCPLSKCDIPTTRHCCSPATQNCPASHTMRAPECHKSSHLKWH